MRWLLRLRSVTLKLFEKVDRGKIMSGNYKSVFDIIGPVMVGPSSSHTAGAVAIGHVAHKLFSQKITKITVDYYESFAQTHRGHGTDFAIVAGILGMGTADLRVPQAVKIAREGGIKVKFIEHRTKSPIHHPNTAIITLENENKKIQIAGCSIGGGTIEIRGLKLDGHELSPKGPLPMVLCWIKDGQQELIEQRLQADDVVIKRTSQSVKAEHCLLEVELDKKPNQDALAEIAQLTHELVCL